MGGDDKHLVVIETSGQMVDGNASTIHTVYMGRPLKSEEIPGNLRQPLGVDYPISFEHHIYDIYGILIGANKLTVYSSRVGLEALSQAFNPDKAFNKTEIPLSDELRLGLLELMSTDVADTFRRVLRNQ